MLKALSKTDLFQVLSLMAKREAEFEKERVNRPISIGFGEAMKELLNPKPLTDIELEYQRTIQSMSDAAHIELKALLLIGRSSSFHPSGWQDTLRHASMHSIGESDPYKNWLWNRCASLRELTMGCCHLLCESKASESNA